MKRSALLVLATTFLLAACDKLPNPASMAANSEAAPSAGAAVVLDLAAVAKALGRDETLKQQVQAAGQQLQQQLAQFSSGLQEKLRAEQAKLGENPSEEQRQELQKQLLDAQRQVQQSQVAARQKAAQFQNQLALSFRDELRPVAAEIARAKGASSVLLANGTLWFDPAVDITGEVIDAMRAKGAATGAPILAPQPQPPAAQ